MRGWILSLILTAGLGLCLRAQDEQALKNRFEGRKVAVKIDCPATNAGIDVDVFPDGGSQLDYNSYAKRLKSYGVALADGDSVLVTKVKAKKDMIEFQLGGGGYGTVGDDTDASVQFTPQEKSQREKDLEKAFDNEQDPKKKSLIKQELDALRWKRERDDNRNRRAAEAAAAAKADLIQQKRLQGGSRFNLYFGGRIASQDLTPERITKALDRWVDFSEPRAGGASAEMSADAGKAAPPAVAEPPTIRKGMSREEVEAVLGSPLSMSEKMEGSLKLLTCVYRQGGERVEAVFCDGTLIRHTITSE